MVIIDFHSYFNKGNLMINSIDFESSHCIILITTLKHASLLAPYEFINNSGLVGQNVKFLVMEHNVHNAIVSFAHCNITKVCYKCRFPSNHKINQIWSKSFDSKYRF